MHEGLSQSKGIDHEQRERNMGRKRKIDIYIIYRERDKGREYQGPRKTYTKVASAAAAEAGHVAEFNNATEAEKIKNKKKNKSSTK